jgi:hypothetical protein
MSFLGGAECSTTGNPLRQFTKHVQDDKSLQRDRLTGRGPGGMQEGMRNQSVAGGQDKVRELLSYCRDSNDEFAFTPRWRSSLLELRKKSYNGWEAISRISQLKGSS